MSYEDVKREVAIGNRVLAQVGLCDRSTLSVGHVSLRIPEAPDLFVVKGRGYEIDAIPAMRAADMIVCDLNGEKVDGPRLSTQCYEVKIHSAIYKNYPDIKSVLHVHPPYTVLMGVCGSALLPMGFGRNGKQPPIWPHKRLVSSDEDGEGLAALMKDSDVAMLLGHGAVSTGSSISQSILTMINLEEQARLNYLAVCAFGRDHPGVAEELLVEMANAPSWWDLPHFKNSLPEGAGHEGSRPGGAYWYWASQVEDGV